MKLESFIDHTLLKPTATPQDIKILCEEAKKYNFHAICVNGCYVALAKKELADTSVKIAAVIGFPLGASSTESKVFEAKTYIKNGAQEIDMVLNIGFLKAKMFKEVSEEIVAIKNVIGKNTLKVILETCYLSKEEIIKACQLAKAGGADFVKTSTGFGPEGANEEVVNIMLKEVGNSLKVKASGGIRDTATARKYIEMGVSRIGTSSGIEIVKNKI